MIGNSNNTYLKIIKILFGGNYMFKSNIGLPLIFFVLITIKQLIFNDKINWIYNIGLSIFIFLAYVFWEWIQKPYKRNENKNSN